MNVLVIGSGGREHALAWKLSNSPKVGAVFVAPGNAGTAHLPKTRNITQVDNAALVQFAKSNQIALTVVGPEAPLAKGLVDAFRAEGLAIFGPTKAAAQLESSKAFAKDFMARHGIPTAFYGTFTDAPSATNTSVTWLSTRERSTTLATGCTTPIVSNRTGIAFCTAVDIRTGTPRACGAPGLGAGA